MEKLDVRIFPEIKFACPERILNFNVKPGMNLKLCNGCGQNNSTAADYQTRVKLLKSNPDICFKNTLLKLTFTEMQTVHCVVTVGCANDVYYRDLPPSKESDKVDGRQSKKRNLPHLRKQEVNFI